MQCFIVLCAISLQWIFFGYSLSFAPGNGFWGGLSWIGLHGVGSAPMPEYAATIPHSAFMIFQAMFAVITPALIIGAFAERMKFSAFLIFAILWATLVYDPICHWVWGSGGWLKKMGVLDFAGGTVVHINAGIAALVTALIIGKRKGIRPQAGAAAQSAVCRIRCRSSLVRLVRFQCRQRAGCKRPGSKRFYRDTRSRGRRRPHVGISGMDTQR